MMLCPHRSFDRSKRVLFVCSEARKELFCTDCGYVLVLCWHCRSPAGLDAASGYYTTCLMCRGTGLVPAPRHVSEPTKRRVTNIDDKR